MRSINHQSCWLMASVIRCSESCWSLLSLLSLLSLVSINHDCTRAPSCCSSFLLDTERTVSGVTIRPQTAREAIPDDHTQILASIIIILKLDLVMHMVRKQVNKQHKRFPLLLPDETDH